MEQITVVAVDPGPEVSGLVILQYGQIVKAGNPENRLLFNIMLEYETTNVPLLVVIEDVKPYRARLRQDLIDTCKWLGELEYRLKSLNIAYRLISRSTVKKWIFDTYPEISIPRIEKEIICRNHRRKDGEYCKPSAKYVNDRVVETAMRHAWQIEKPKPGKSNRYGLTDHSYQALALACCFLDMKAPTSIIHEKTVQHILAAQGIVSERIKASTRASKRLGGLKGGKARAEKLSPERRAEIAQKAAKARWNK